MWCAYKYAYLKAFRGKCSNTLVSYRVKVKRKRKVQKRNASNRIVRSFRWRLGEKPWTIGESYDISISPRETPSGGSNSSGRKNNPLSIPRDKKRSESVIDMELVNSEPITCKSFSTRDGKLRLISRYNENQSVGPRLVTVYHRV